MRREKTEYPSHEHFRGLNLKPEHQDFVMAYCNDFRFNVGKAYIASVATDPGMDINIATSCGCKLLNDARIKKAVELEMERLLANRDKLTQRVIEEHAAIAFAHTDMMHDGITTFGYTVKDMKDIPLNYRAAIKGFKKTGDGLLEVLFYDKQKSLDSLARMLGMFDDNARRVGDKYEDMIQEMRRRKDGQDAPG